MIKFRALELQLALIPFTASRPRYIQSVNIVTDRQVLLSRSGAEFDFY